jgi:hypothetical protein
LVCESVCDLIHSLVCSLIPQIKSNDSLELDFHWPGSGLWMHFHYLPKERLPMAPRTSKEPALQVDLVLFNASIDAQ